VYEELLGIVAGTDKESDQGSGSLAVTPLVWWRWKEEAWSYEKFGASFFCFFFSRPESETRDFSTSFFEGVLEPIVM
jgi:hypothetical protein